MIDILTPHADDPYVIDLLEMIPTAQEFTVIQIEPEPGPVINDCFETVRKKVDADGGEAIYGWQIWKLPYLIQAEFHTVWKTSQGELKDITPKLFALERILFVRDSTLAYEGKQVDSVRLNITDNKLVDHFIQVSEALFRLKNKGHLASLHGPDFTRAIMQLSEMDQKVLIAFNRMSEWMESTIIQGGTINSPCFCEEGLRGRTYGECHAIGFEENILTVK